MTAYYVDNGDDDGAVLGRSSGKIGFFGTTPITKPVVTSISTTTSTTTLLETRCKRLEDALKNLGLVSFS